MSDNGDLREDLKVPDGELGTQLKAEYEAGKELLVRGKAVVMYMILASAYCLEQLLIIMTVNF